MPLSSDKAGSPEMVMPPTLRPRTKTGNPKLGGFYHPNGPLFKKPRRTMKASPNKTAAGGMNPSNVKKPGGRLYG